MLTVKKPFVTSITIHDLQKGAIRTCSLHKIAQSKTLFTWSGGPRSSGVGFFCFHALADTKEKKPTPLDAGAPLHVNRV